MTSVHKPGGYCRVEGSSSSGAALDKTDVALYAARAKVERSEDGAVAGDGSVGL